MGAVRDINLVEKVVEDVDAVFHEAALVDVSAHAHLDSMCDVKHSLR